MVAWRVAHTFGKASRKIVIAISRLSNAIGATDYDVGFTRVVRTVGAVWVVGRTGVDSGGWVVSHSLGRCESDRGGEENDRVDHFDYGIEIKVFKTC